MKTTVLFILPIIVLVLSSCSTKKPVDGIKIWEGSLDVHWNLDKPFDPELFDSLRAGDELVIGLEYTGSPWPIVALFDDKHMGMAGAGRWPIDESTTEISYNVTYDMNKTIHKSGVVLSGEGYTAKSIKIIHHEPIDNIEDATWFGHVEMTPAWKRLVTLSQNTFANVDEGDILRFVMSDVTDTACFKLWTMQWTPMPNGLNGLNGKTDFEYAINHEAIELLHRDGLLINGTGFSLDRIELKKPIWKGTEVVNWNNHIKVKIAPEVFKDVKVGDKLITCYGYIGDDEWPQIAFLDEDWHDIPGTGKILLYSIMNSCSLYVTQEMLDHIKSKGMYISGAGYILKSLCVVKGDFEPYMKDAKWIGETKMTSDWNTVQRLSATCFTDANVGDIMRLSVSDVGVNAMISLRLGSWEMYEQIEGARLSQNAKTYDYELTDKLLRSIRENEGCVLFGTGYTLKAMHIVKKGE